MSVGQHAPALRTACILDAGSCVRGEGKARAQHACTSCERLGGLATAGFSLSGRIRDEGGLWASEPPTPARAPNPRGSCVCVAHEWRWVVRAPPIARQPREGGWWVAGKAHRNTCEKHVRGFEQLGLTTLPSVASPFAGRAPATPRSSSWPPRRTLGRIPSKSPPFSSSFAVPRARK